MYRGISCARCFTKSCVLEGVGVAGKSVKLQETSSVKKMVLKTREKYHRMRRALHATFVLNCISTKQVENKP